MKILMFIPLFIIWGVLMYVFSRPYMKIIDNENFVFKRGSRNLFLSPSFFVSRTLIACWWLIGGALSMYFLSQLGIVLGDTNQSQANFWYKETVVVIIIPIIIMIAFSVWGTRKLAQKGHLTASYANPRVNSRAIVLHSLLMIFEIGLFFTVIFYWTSLSVEPKGIFGFIVFILYIIIATFNNKIVEVCLKIILGKYLKTDYEPIIARGMEKYGITKEDFYRVTLKEKYPDGGEIGGK